MSYKTTNLKSWSAQKYVVAVLWMEGRLSTSEIAKQVRWTGGQVRGFYTREFDPPRVNMTKEERQIVLDDLKGWRDWFKKFEEARFEDRFHAKEIASERLAVLRQAEARRLNDETPKLSKKEARRLQNEQAHREREEARQAAERSLGYAPRGLKTDALEWLSLHALGDKGEATSVGSVASRDRRKEALLKFRVHIEGASISPLKAQDYGAVRGAGAKIALPEFRKHCIDMLGGIRTLLPRTLYVALEGVVMRDDFFWLRAKEGAQRAGVFTGLRYGADLLAVYYQITAPSEFKARWNEEPPTTVLPTRKQARQDSRHAQQIVDELARAIA
jgi:hypothetical protein